MEERRFGRHDAYVSEVGLGCSLIQPLASFFPFSRADRLINHAVDQGIRFFDTADSYGAGWSERWLGKALKSRRDLVMIATKCGLPVSLVGKAQRRLFAGYTTSRSGFRYTSAYVEDAALRSLKRLDTTYIDVYLLHSPSIEVLRTAGFEKALKRLKENGTVRFWGISARSAESAAFAIGELAVDCVELELNLCNEDKMSYVVRLAREHGTALIAREVLGSGQLLEAASSNARKHGVHLEASSIAPLLVRDRLADRDVSVAVVGMRSIDHINDITRSQGAYESTPESRRVLSYARRGCTEDYEVQHR